MEGAVKNKGLLGFSSAETRHLTQGCGEKGFEWPSMLLVRREGLEHLVIMLQGVGSVAGEEGYR